MEACDRNEGFASCFILVGPLILTLQYRGVVVPSHFVATQAYIRVLYGSITVSEFLFVSVSRASALELSDADSNSCSHDLVGIEFLFEVRVHRSEDPLAVCEAMVSFLINNRWCCESEISKPACIGG